MIRWCQYDASLIASIDHFVLFKFKWQCSLRVPAWSKLKWLSYTLDKIHFKVMEQNIECRDLKDSGDFLCILNINTLCCAT